jgi:uncharacterized small protein (TIGR04563 family)
MSDESRPSSCKKTIYFPSAMLEEIMQECTRLERSFSWVMQRAWRFSKQSIQDMPGLNDIEGIEEPPTEEKINADAR